MMMTETVSGPKLQEHDLPDERALALRVAEITGSSLRRALVEREQASLVVSGGRTAKVILPELQKLSLPWERVHVTLADDRWVESTSKDSNEALVRELFLFGPAAAAQFHGLYARGRTVQEACEHHERALPFMPHPFDVVLLGMGEDGHTASLYPTTPLEVLEARSNASFVPGLAPSAPRERISYTPRALLRSRRIVIAFQGREKRAVLAAAKQRGPVQELPVRAIVHGTPQVPRGGDLDVVSCL